MKRLIINVDQGVRRRVDGKGIAWVHVTCPLCLQRGYGPDRSSHLGIGVMPSGQVISKCLRCEGKLPRGTKILSGGREFDLKGLPSSGPAGRGPGARAQESDPRGSEELEAPGVPLGTLPRESAWVRAVLKNLPESWAGLEFEDLVRGGLRVGDQALGTLWLPVWTTKGWGYLVRRSGGRGAKVIDHAPRGVGFLRRVDPGESRTWVAVEGWADACAVPPPCEPVICRGTSNFPEVRGELVVALDRDMAGRRGTRKMIARALKRDMTVSVIGDYGGADPASAGMVRMAKAIHDRTPVSGLKEFLNWLLEK